MKNRPRPTFSRPVAGRPASSRVLPRRPISSGNKSSGPDKRVLIGAAVAGGTILILLIGLFALFQWLNQSSVVSTVVVQSPGVTKIFTPTGIAQVITSTVDSGSIPPVTSSPSNGPIAPPYPPNIDALQRYMVKIINDTRLASGLSPVEWDDTAYRAGVSHAQEMTRYSYLSHWDLQGYGPDHRYSEAGGLSSVRENVYSYWHSPGAGPTSEDDWLKLIDKAHSELMNSEGHRDNIMAPDHTHVGIGIAYDPAKGWLSIAQEFVDQYVTLQPVQTRAALGDVIILSGIVNPQAKAPFINLAYEPFPAPKSLEELKQSGTYNSAAEFYDAVSLAPNSNGAFIQNVVLNNQNKPGVYHVRIFADTPFGQIMISDIAIQVR